MSMETHSFAKGVTLCILLGIGMQTCTTDSSTSTATETQGASQVPALFTPDHPGGKGHTNKKDKEDLKILTENYAAINFPPPTKPTEENPKLYYIDRKIIDAILNQKDCKGLRIYLAYKSQNEPHMPRLIVVGVEKKSGKDQIDTYEDKATKLRKDCTVIETDDKCPSNCDGTYY